MLAEMTRAETFTKKYESFPLPDWTPINTVQDVR